MRTSEKPRPLCGCGKPVTYHSKTIKGFKVWKTGCGNCEYHAKKNRKDYCENCGGTKKLQIDHIDGNRSNNNPKNLKTLCRSCHDDKTTSNQEWKPRK
jgi:5-methylcytosine-specific restriction endonuclease McrA